ncbi:hypothetical protein AURDEDRAFT_114286 [Auricularia subglabra TFB-10046 SS5]|nr:hypothetical protein AURDEDRAFT_114286 [Auricularia subglabra TFB-10046 SS5]
MRPLSDTAARYTVVDQRRPPIIAVNVDAVDDVILGIVYHRPIEPSMLVPGTYIARAPTLNRSLQLDTPSTPASSHSATAGADGPDEPCTASLGPAGAMTALTRATPAPLRRRSAGIDSAHRQAATRHLRRALDCGTP